VKVQYFLCLVVYSFTAQGAAPSGTKNPEHERKSVAAIITAAASPVHGAKPSPSPQISARKRGSIALQPKRWEMQWWKGSETGTDKERRVATAAIPSTPHASVVSVDGNRLSLFLLADAAHEPPEIAEAIKPFAGKSVEDLLKEYGESEVSLKMIRIGHNAAGVNQSRHLEKIRAGQEERQQSRLMALQYHLLNGLPYGQVTKIAQLSINSKDRVDQVTALREHWVQLENLARDKLWYLQVPCDTGKSEHLWHYLVRETSYHRVPNFGKQPISQADTKKLMAHFKIEQTSVDKRVNELFDMLCIGGSIKDGVVVDIPRLVIKPYADQARMPQKVAFLESSEAVTPHLRTSQLLFKRPHVADALLKVVPSFDPPPNSPELAKASRSDDTPPDSPRGAPMFVLPSFLNYEKIPLLPDTPPDSPRN